MRYKQIRKLKASQFKRRCGVKPEVFQTMVSTLKQELPRARQRVGQPKFSVEEALLHEYLKSLYSKDRQLNYLIEKSFCSKALGRKSN